MSCYNRKTINIWIFYCCYEISAIAFVSTVANIPDGINSNSTLNEEFEIYKFKENKKKYDKKLKKNAECCKAIFWNARMNVGMLTEFEKICYPIGPCIILDF